MRINSMDGSSKIGILPINLMIHAVVPIYVAENVRQKDLQFFHSEHGNYYIIIFEGK